jgi:hypothetical protein
MHMIAGFPGRRERSNNLAIEPAENGKTINNRCLGSCVGSLSAARSGKDSGAVSGFDNIERQADTDRYSNKSE